MTSPSDISSLEALIQSGKVDPKHVIAIIAKTEGNGSPTDYSVELAERALTRCLCEAASMSVGEFERQTSLFVEGGAEGIISPMAWF